MSVLGSATAQMTYGPGSARPSRIGQVEAGALSSVSGGSACLSAFVSSSVTTAAASALRATKPHFSSVRSVKARAVATDRVAGGGVRSATLGALAHPLTRPSVAERTGGRQPQDRHAM